MAARIFGIEYVYPERKISNDDLAKEFPEYDFLQFEAKVGIRNRYIAGKDETGLDLAVEACVKLFKRFDRSSIDYICYCTQTPDYILPTTACLLQDRLGLGTNVGAFDFNLGCSGFTYGLSIAKGLIETKQAKNVLLVTADTYSKLLNPMDRSNRSIFGDGATASIIGEDKINGIGDFVFGTDGSGHDKLIVRNGGARSKACLENMIKNNRSEYHFSDNDLYMNGPDVFNFTIGLIPNLISQVLTKNEIEKESIHQFVFHQANAFMLNFMRKQLRIQEDLFFIDLLDGGNTVSSTIPIALKKYSDSVNNEQHNIVVAGFGVGLSWCAGLINIYDRL